MNDEEGTQELCMQAGRWLFWAPGVIPRPGQVSDQEGSRASGTLTDVRVQVHTSCACIQLPVRTSAVCLVCSVCGASLCSIMVTIYNLNT